MKNLILTILLLTANLCIGQKSQFSFQLSSGLFSFGGKSATSTSSYHSSDVPTTVPSSTDNPYGNRSSFSYGVGVQFQQVTVSHFIYGLQLSYESLSSSVTVDRIYGEIAGPGFSVIADAKTVLTNNFINLSPMFGRRIKIFNNIESDLLLGCDFGIGLSSKERLIVGNDSANPLEREIPKMDFRPRIECISYYKNFGLSVGYSYGQTNYRANLIGSDLEVKARYLRFGLHYRLK